MSKTNKPSAADERRLEKASAAVMKLLRKNSADAIEIGRLLTEAKSDLDHGYFVAWMEKTFPFGRRMGQTYMRLHHVLGAHAEHVGLFQVATLSALASKAVTDEQRATVLGELAQGELVSDQQVMSRLTSLVAPDRLEIAEKNKAKRTVARKQLALLSLELAGDRISELVALLRSSGLDEIADTIEDVMTAPDKASDDEMVAEPEAAPAKPGSSNAKLPSADTPSRAETEAKYGRAVEEGHRPDFLNF